MLVFEAFLYFALLHYLGLVDVSRMNFPAKGQSLRDAGVMLPRLIDFQITYRQDLHSSRKASIRDSCRNLLILDQRLRLTPNLVHLLPSPFDCELPAPSLSFIVDLHIPAA